MKNTLLFTALLFCVNLQGLGQVASDSESQESSSYLASLLYSNQPFDEIVAAADAYFADKYPGMSAAELSSGAFRDGDFVKYQRWQAYWKNHLNSDGTLGDPTKINKSQTRGVRGAECGDSQILVDWTNVNYNGNMGLQIDQGRTNSIAFHPSDANTYYVGAAFGGLWKTTDGGESYINLNDNLPLAAVAGIVIDPLDPNHIAVALSDIVWYGPPALGVYVSTDGGSTFEATDYTYNLSSGIRIYYMDQNPFNGNEVMLASSDGTFKTTDFFETIDEVHPLSSRSVKYSLSTENLVFVGGGSGQFYRSTDAGDSFDLISDFGSNDVRLAVSREAGSQRVALSTGNSLIVSEDNGDTYVTHSLPESNMVVEFAVSNDDIIHVGNFEVYRSNDFGASFSPVSHWLGSDGLPFIHVDQRNVFVNPLQPNYVYFCNDGGIFRYAVAEDVFANLSTDLIITQYYDIAVSQTEQFVVGGGSQDNGNIFREDDGTWFSYAQTGDGMGQEIDPVNAGIRYWSYQVGGLRRWEAGSNVGIAPPGEDGMGAWETPFKLDPNDHNRLFVGYNSVYVSENNGDTWTTVGDVVNPSNDLEQIAIAPSNSEKIYASQYRRLYIKSPGIDAWDMIITPVNQPITDLEVDPEDENIIYVSYGGYTEEGKVYKSIDGGETWINFSGTLPNFPITSLEVYDSQPGGVFIGTIGAVYYRDDRFSDWLKVGCLPNVGVNDIEIQYFTNKIFVGTHGRGMFEAPIEFNIATIWEDGLSGEEIVLLYPNPAAEKASIRANGIDLSSVNVQITDASGRIIEASYELTENGEIELNCEQLDKGTYFVLILHTDGSKHLLNLVKW